MYSMPHPISLVIRRVQKLQQIGTICVAFKVRCILVHFQLYLLSRQNAATFVPVPLAAAAAFLMAGPAGSVLVLAMARGGGRLLMS